MVSRTAVAASAMTLAAALPGTAAASSQGSLGASSTAQVIITVSVSPRAQVSGLGDMAFASGATATRRAHDLCIWGNAVSQPYTLVATGSGPAGSFELSNGAASIGYTVKWSQERSGDEVPTAILQAAASEAECAVGLGTVGLVVALETTGLEPAGSSSPYTGVLNLTVAPQ